jgi:hypothetical protein
VGELLNPFGAPARKKTDEEEVADLKNVCPFMSVVMPAPALVAGGEITTVLYPTICLGRGCAVYSTKKDRCGLSLG